MHDGTILKVLGPAFLALALAACGGGAGPDAAEQGSSIVGRWRGAQSSDTGAPNFARVETVRTVTFSGRSTSGTYVSSSQVSDAGTGCVSEEVIRGQWVLLDDSVALAASDGTTERRDCTDPPARRPVGALDADALRAASETLTVAMWQEPSIGWRALILGGGRQAGLYTRQ